MPENVSVPGLGACNMMGTSIGRRLRRNDGGLMYRHGFAQANIHLMAKRFLVGM